MRVRDRREIAAGIGIITVLLFSGLFLFQAWAADPIVGQWSYSSSNHWSKRPVPAGHQSKGVVVIEPSGEKFKMVFKSGMVFNPPELKNYTGEKNGEEYVFSNSAPVDNEGGVAKNNCSLKSADTDQYAGKSFSQYSNGAVTFHWGFDIVLTK